MEWWIGAEGWQLSHGGQGSQGGQGLQDILRAHGAHWSEGVSRLLRALGSQSEQLEVSVFAALFLWRPLKECCRIVDAVSCGYTFPSFSERSVARVLRPIHPRVGSRLFEAQIRKGQDFYACVFWKILNIRGDQASHAGFMRRRDDLQIVQFFARGLKPHRPN